MKLQPQIEINTPSGETKWIQSFFLTLRTLYQQIAIAFNGNVGFGDGTISDNIDGSWVLAASVIGNFTVTHNLGRIPIGWILVSTDAFENLRFVSSTTKTLTLAGQNGGANVKLFVI